MNRRTLLSGGLAFAATPAIATPLVSRWRPGEAVALCIGCTEYQNAPNLRFAGNDAQALAKVLSWLGFESRVLLNPSSVSLSNALSNFGTRAASSKLMLIFFAGHGYMSNGETFALLGDAPIEASSGRTHAFPEHRFTESMASEARDKVLIFDACRSNPFIHVEKLPRGGKRNFSTVAGQFTAFATQPGADAYDGQTANSPFIRALVSQLLNAPKTIEDTMRSVRLEVIRETGGRQVPWSRSSLLRDLSLHGSMT